MQSQSRVPSGRFVTQESITDRQRLEAQGLPARAVLRILVPGEIPMSFLRPEDHAKMIMDRFQRLAVRAACAGITASVLLGLLKLIMDRVAPGSAQLRGSFEAVCALLWPSAALLLGAQTSRGQAVLFVMSTCLNAGYFVFGAMLIAGLLDKIRSNPQVGAPAGVLSRAYSRPQVTVKRVSSTRSLA
jgi:hypothetical protein